MSAWSEVLVPGCEKISQPPAPSHPIGGDVWRALDGPLIILFQQDGADEFGRWRLHWEDADDLCASLDLADRPFDRVGGVQLGAVLGREAHVGQHVSLGVVHQSSQLRHLGPDLVSNSTPLLLCGLGVVLSEGGGYEGRDDPSAAPGGVGQTLRMKSGAFSTSVRRFIISSVIGGVLRSELVFATRP